jgi:NDP-sugar pyrophosphorylase family protein
MAGKGTRTKELGEFKPFIKIKSKLMIEWLLSSIKDKISDSDSLIFITTKYYADKYDVSNKLSNILQLENIPASFKLILCGETPLGPSATVYKAKKDILKSNDSTIVVNADQYIDFDMFDSLENRTGFLPVYAEFTQKSSYVEVQKGRITKIVEKRNISNLASAGVYCVSNGEDLIRAIEIQFEKKDMLNGEYYVGPALNNLIAEGYTFFPVPVYTKYDLGTISGISKFKKILLADYVD